MRYMLSKYKYVCEVKETEMGKGKNKRWKGMERNKGIEIKRY